MLSDNVSVYKDNLEYWAALCAMDSIRYEGAKIDPDTAGNQIDGVWEFVTETCDDVGYAHPDRDKSVLFLKDLIVDFCKELDE